MPTTDRPTQNQTRAVVTATTPLAAMQLARDLSANASLQVSFATGESTLWQEIDANHPQVVLLDTRIAGHHAPTLVSDLVQRATLPVLIRTEIRENSPQMLLDCLSAGAIGILDKPTSMNQTAESIPTLIWNLKAASNAAMEKFELVQQADWLPLTGGQAEGIFAIGAGLGATVALEKLLMQLPHTAPATVVCTALPFQIINAWADRLRKHCKIQLKIARDGDIVQTGQVLIAPGDRHLLLRRGNSDWIARIKDGPAVFHQKPSTEILFGSLAETGHAQAVCVLLGGAGVDGIAGLLQLRKAGARTIVESPSTSVVSDLPTRAFQCVAAEVQLPANNIAAKMIELATTQSMPRAA